MVKASKILKQEFICIRSEFLKIYMFSKKMWRHCFLTVFSDIFGFRSLIKWFDYHIMCTYIRFVYVSLFKLADMRIHNKLY